MRPASWRRLELYSPTLAEWGWPEVALPAYIKSHVHPDALEAEAHAREEREAGEDDGIKRPEFVMLGSYKPQFLRDLGL